MPLDNGKYITWQTVAVIISMLILMLGVGAVISSKADKDSLAACENRINERVTGVERRLDRDIRDIKDKQDKVYDLLFDKFGGGK